MILEEVGILVELPKVELAKLVGEAEEVCLQAGETLSIDDAVYIVMSGTIQISSHDASDPNSVALTQIGTGEVVGEWSLIPGCDEPPVVVATTESVLFRITSTRWNALIRKHPTVGLSFQTSVLERLLQTQRTLARYKQYVNTYISEIWSAADEAPMEAAAAALAAERPKPPSAAPPPAPGAPVKQRSKDHLFWAISAGCVVAGVVTMIMTDQPADAALLGLPILIWTALNWYLGAIPDYAVALTACLATVTLGIGRADDTFSGFADPTWFLLLGAFGIGAAVQRSGLLYRAALHLLRFLPPTYLGQTTALAIAGTILTPCLPSVQSRVTMSGLLARELSEAMRFAPRSSGSAGLAMSAFLGFGQMRFLFLNGSSYSLLAWGLMPTLERQTSGWMDWFWVALPMGLLILGATHLLTVKVLFPEKNGVVSRAVINRQLAILGDLTNVERLTTLVTLAVFCGFFLQPLHKIEPSWIAMGGFLVLVTFGAVDKETIVTNIDWQYMLFYGSLAGMVALVSKLNLTESVADWIIRGLGGAISSAPAFFLVLAASTVLLRMLFQPAPTILLVTVPFFPLSLSLGYNPLIVAVVAVVASTTWIIPHLLSSYGNLTAATQGQCYDEPQVRPLAYLHGLIVLAAVVCSIPYWKWLGILNR